MEFNTLATNNFPSTEWLVRFLDDGAVVYHVSTGHTHALDLLTAEVLITLQENSKLLASPAQLAAELTQRLEIPLDDTMHQAILASLEKLQQLSQE